MEGLQQTATIDGVTSPSCMGRAVTAEGRRIQKASGGRTRAPPVLLLSISAVFFSITTSSTLLALIFTTWGHGVILRPHTMGMLAVGQVVLFNKFCLITTSFLPVRSNEWIIRQLSLGIWPVVNVGILYADCSVQYNSCKGYGSVPGKKIFGENFSHVSSVCTGHGLPEVLCSRIVQRWGCITSAP